MNDAYEQLRQAVQAWAAAGYLPETLAYGFVVNALLAGLLIGPVLGGLGTLVVVKRFAFFSEAVGHAALTGVAIGILLGEPYTGPYGSLFGYCLLFGVLLNYLRNRTGLAPDTLIGVFLSVSLALGASLLLVLAGKINVHILENVLFGSVLTVNGHDLAVLAAVAVLVPCLALPLYNRIMLASFNPQLAAVRGVAVKSLDYLFVALVTLVTVAAVKVIGAILVGALLVIPAAAARLVSQSLKGFFWLAVLIATVSTLAGILLPIMFDLPIPSGAAIILVAGLAFGLAAIARGCLPHLKGTPDEPETPLPRPGPGLRRTRRPAPGPRRDAGRAQSAPVTVLASLPVTHALAERLLRDTEVKLQRVAPANLPASRQASFFAGRGAGGLAKAAGQADAVIDLRSIWSDDPLYPLARRSNIRIVEIDAARPVDGALPGVALRPGSDLHAYPWLNPTNLGRMADVLASDLERLAPGAAATIQANLATLKKQLLEATASNETRLAKADNLSVISLSERLGYLLAGLNLDPLDVEIQADDGWTETNIQAFAEELKSEDIALVLHHRQPPKPLADAIAASGARLVVVDTEAADPVAGLESDMKAIVEGLLAGKG